MVQKGIPSQIELQGRLGFKSRSTVCDILKGRERVPVSRVDLWAKALRLTKAERVEFEDLVSLSYVSPGFLRRWKASEARIAELEHELDQLRGLAERFLAKRAPEARTQRGNSSSKVG